MAHTSEEQHLGIATRRVQIVSGQCNFDYDYDSRNLKLGQPADSATCSLFPDARVPKARHFSSCGPLTTMPNQLLR
jgi:hypothetical protein